MHRTILVFLAYTLAGVFGREHFSAILSNFLAVLGMSPDIAYYISLMGVVRLLGRFLHR